MNSHTRSHQPQSSSTKSRRTTSKRKGSISRDKQEKPRPLGSPALVSKVGGTSRVLRQLKQQINHMQKQVQLIKAHFRPLSPPLGSTKVRQEKEEESNLYSTVEDSREEVGWLGSSRQCQQAQHYNNYYLQH